MQSGKVTVRSGTSKITVKLPEPMSRKTYFVALSVLEPEHRNVNPTVEYETKTCTEFVVTFEQKLESKLTLAWTVGFV